MGYGLRILGFGALKPIGDPEKKLLPEKPKLGDAAAFLPAKASTLWSNPKLGPGAGPYFGFRVGVPI